MYNELLKVFLNNIKSAYREENYKEFVSNMDEETIRRILMISFTMNNDNNKFEIASKSFRKKLEKELLKNTYEVYSNLFLYTNNFIFELKKLLDNNIYMIKIADFDYSIDFLQKIILFGIGYIKCKKDIISIFIPNEEKEILKSIVNNKKLIKNVENNNIIIHNVNNLLSVYGIIEYSKLNELYGKIYKKSISNLLEIITKNSVVEEEINFYKDKDHYIIYNEPAFKDLKHAREFYNSLDSAIDYKLYKKHEYEEIGECTYHFEFEEFNSLYAFLSIKFNMSEDDIFEFDEVFVSDYIYSYQVDHEQAISNLENNLFKIFGKLDNRSKKIIMSSILNIARKYPDFKYKGNTYYDIEKNS